MLGELQQLSRKPQPAGYQCICCEGGSRSDRAGRAGWGGSQKNKKNKIKTKSPCSNLHSTELIGREDGNMLNTNLKMTLDKLKVCKVNTRGVLSVTSMINTGLCGICEKGFPEAKNQVNRKERSKAKQRRQHKDVSQAGGGHCCNKWARYDVSTEKNNQRSRKNPSTFYQQH